MSIKYFVFKNIAVYSLSIMLFGIIGNYFGLTTFPQKKIVDESIKKQTIYFYYGSSVNHSIAAGDSDRRSITEMMKDNFRVNDICDISHEAYHSTLHEKFYEYIQKNKNINTTVSIIEINLRSFSPEWIGRPTYQFEKEKYILEKQTFIRYPFGVLDLFPIPFIPHETTEKTFKAAPVFFGKERLGTVSDFLHDENITPTDSLIARQIIFHYLYALDSISSRIVSLENILNLASNKHQKVLFYVTPIDYDEGRKYFGKKYDVQVGKNISVIKRLTEMYAVSFVDLSAIIPHQGFNYVHFPNEHLKQEGRKIVADTLTSYLRLMRL